MAGYRLSLVRAGYRTFPSSHKVQLDKTGQENFCSVLGEVLGSYKMSGILGQKVKLLDGNLSPKTCRCEILVYTNLMMWKLHAKNFTYRLV